MTFERTGLADARLLPQRNGRGIFCSPLVP